MRPSTIAILVFLALCAVGSQAVADFKRAAEAHARMRSDKELSALADLAAKNARLYQSGDTGVPPPDVTKMGAQERAEYEALMETIAATFGQPDQDAN